MTDPGIVAQGALALWSEYRDARTSLMTYWAEHPDAIDVDPQVNTEKVLRIARREDAQSALINFYRQHLGDGAASKVEAYLDAEHDYYLAQRHSGQDHPDVVRMKEQLDAARAALDELWTSA